MSHFTQSGRPGEVRAVTAHKVSTRPMGTGHSWPERGEASKVVRSFGRPNFTAPTRDQVWANARRYGQA